MEMWRQQVKQRLGTEEEFANKSADQNNRAEHGGSLDAVFSPKNQQRASGLYLYFLFTRSFLLCDGFSFEELC